MAEPPKPKRPPWKLALFAFGITIVLGMVVGFAIYQFGADANRLPPEQAGERFGRGLFPVALLASVITYLWARRRS